MAHVEPYPGRNLTQNSWDFGGFRRIFGGFCGFLGIFGVHIKQFPTGFEA
jgi:hypothetical protein